MKRFEVWIVRLDPVLGSEIGKTRPGVIVSPDEANRALRTVLIAPLTSERRPWPTRIPVEIDNVAGDMALDQIRAADKVRLARKISSLPDETAKTVADRLVEMFAL
jgi:mRNA interferase MazF